MSSKAAKLESSGFAFPPPAITSSLKTLLSLGAGSGDNGDGFPAYLRSARAEGMDVNDWIEARLGWVPALPVLEQLVFPLLTSNSVVCEVGVGTGRWSRHIVPKIPDGKLVLVDRSRWIVSFVRDYFADSRNVRAVHCDGGAHLPFEESEWADVFFSQGLFITMKLGHISQYLSEFGKSLKRGGYAVFDFIDPSNPLGWEFLQRESERAYDVFAYHSIDHVTACCSAAGLHVEQSASVGKSTYVVARKI